MAYVNNSVGEEQWDDIIVPGFALGSGASAPATTAFTPVTGMNLYGFSGTNSTPDELYATMELPHTYKEGTDLHPHVHWSPATNAAGNVAWQIDYSVQNINNGIVYPNSTRISGASAASTVAFSHQLTEIDGPIPGTGRKIGDVITMRLFRDPTIGQDTYAGAAMLLSLGIHYRRDTLGSRGELTK